MKKLCRAGGFFLMLFAAPVVFGQTADLQALKEEAVSETDKLQTFTQQMVDEIFSFSELGFQEVETSRYVTGILEKNGFHVERGLPAFRRRGWRTTEAANQ